MLEFLRRQIYQILEGEFKYTYSGSYPSESIERF